MCLRINKRVTASLKKKGDSIICWKWLLKSNNHLLSPYVNHFAWKPGWNKSISFGECEPNTKTRVHGIHVYYKLDKAKQNAPVILGGCCLVPVKCNMSDLIAGGNFGHAIFKRVFLKKKDYDENVKNQRKTLRSSKI